MKKIAFFSIYCLFTLTYMASYAYAQEVEVYTELFPPFQTYHNKKISGSATKKVQQILLKANLKTQFNIVPWARAFNIVKQKENTLIYSMNRSPEREPYFHWLSIVGEIKNGFVALKKRNLKLNTLNDAKAYVTVVAIDTYPYDYLKSQGFLEDKNLFIISSRETQLNLLLTGKVDFLFVDLSFVKERLKSRNLSPSLVEHVLTSPDWSKELYLAINRNSDIDLINRLKAAAAEIDTKADEEF